MIPSARLAWLVAVGTPVLLLGVLDTAGVVLALSWNGLLLVGLVFDRWRTADPGRIEIVRSFPGRAVQGRSETVRLDLRNPSSLEARLLVRDLVPATLERERTVLGARVGPGASVRLTYRILPRERGTHRATTIALRCRGPLGLVLRQIVIERPASIRVYPDLVSLPAREAALSNPSSWRHGARLARHQGEGREFHQLREYVQGDDVRFVDWKAFAHRGRPMLREYQLERNQRVLILLDGGRLMTAQIGDRMRFDWAVQAAGRLARAALALGDAVGIAVYSRDVRSSLPAASGRGHLGALADLLADARADLDEPDLGAALRFLLRRNVRRTLVVLFTELSDPRSARASLRHVGALGPRHLGLVVTLADTDLDRERERQPDRPDDLYVRVAAEELWQDRVRTETALRARGSMVVRANADALAAETVERYLEIKRRGRL